MPLRHCILVPPSLHWLQVRDDAQGVAVTTAGGEVLHGDAVVVSVPLGVLKAGSIAFRPALPPWKQEAISRLGFGDLNKVKECGHWA
jgi:monoamine oxidase